MEGVLDFLVSVNKISLIAFLGVFGFLIYEVYLLRKEQLKKQKPTIPQFNTNAVVDTKSVQKQAATIVAPPKKVQPRVKASPLLIIILIFMIVLFLGISAFILLNKKAQNTATPNTPPVSIQEISSAGLKVYDTSWNEVGENEAKSLTAGTTVYVGIQTIAEADIDRARIKVNEKEWNIKHITTKFNNEKKVYYSEYIVATGESALKIDAQLHSETDGWLGD